MKIKNKEINKYIKKNSFPFVCSYCGYIYNTVKAAYECSKSRRKSHKELRMIIKGF